MVTLYIGTAGLLIFVFGVMALGVWLRRHPSKANAEKSSRAAQFLFFAALGTPILISFFYPGLTNLDGLVGWPSLPLRPLFIAAGIILAIPGVYLMWVSNKVLRTLGSGANAFRLTKRTIGSDIYRHTRNPMSLGYYLLSLSIAFISGSTLFTAFVILGVIPAHIFYLKFFEELELKLRFGESYSQYRQGTSFLIPGRPED